MAREIPQWLDKDFISEILSEDEKEVEIKSFDVQPAVGPGYNYTSTIYRVLVNYRENKSKETQSVSLIVKVPLTAGVMAEISEKIDFFGKEPTIYEQYLPFISKKINQHLGPKGYISHKKDIMVMGDLKLEGFVVCKSLKQLNYEHCEKVMEAIAKFHACSLKCFEENPELIKSLGEDALWEDGTTVDMWLKVGTKEVLKVVKQINGDPRFIKFLSSRLDTFYEGVKQINRPKPKGFNVLCHGDLWASNVMFKHDSSQKVLDVKFVDFQMPRWASPAVDLTYFVWTSGNEDVRKNRLIDLYRVYLMHYNKTLEQLGCAERLTWEELIDDLTSAKDWGLVMICLCLPVITSATEDTLDFGNLSEKDFETEEFKNIYYAKNYLSVLPTVLKNYSDFFLSENR